MEIYKETTEVKVSRFNNEGWWIGNSVEVIPAGTGIPCDCTTEIYQPSEKRKTGKFNKREKKWEEIEEKEYWSVYGEKYWIKNTNGIVPKGYTDIRPPSYNSENHEALFKNGNWEIFKKCIGESYWDKDQNEFKVVESFWSCPEGCTLNKPHITREGYCLKLIDSNWVEIVDNRNKRYWDTKTGELKTISEPGIEPDYHWTDKEPKRNSIWNNAEWVIDLDLWLKNEVRPHRNDLLSETDFLYRSDVELQLTRKEKKERDKYCQLLRDFPDSLAKEDITEVIENLNWPEKPKFKKIKI